MANHKSSSGTQNAIILHESEYAHILNQQDGTETCVLGPKRFHLAAHETLLKKSQKIVLRSDNYAVLLNPIESGVNLWGQRRVIRGPTTFALFPGEVLADPGVQDVFLLGVGEAAFVKALNDHTDDRCKKKRVAGEVYLVRGPCPFVLSENEELIEYREAVQVAENEAIYVKDLDTCNVRLVEGPCAYLLSEKEELFFKGLSNPEYEALGIAHTPSFKAFQIHVQKNECVCILDAKSNVEKYILGPTSYLLAPTETIKVISLSGGVPKVENAIKISCVGFGPDFCRDSFRVSTKDNASLEMSVSYKWRFIKDDHSLYKVFQRDFIGYSCQSLRSRIREECSHFNFEEFHANSTELLRKKIFKNYEIPTNQNGKQGIEKVYGRYFAESSFLIFELEVKSLTPTDKEIEKLLDASIKSSMNILCNQMNEQAQQEQEIEQIKSETELCELKRSVIELETANHEKELVGKTKLENDTLVEKAKAEKESIEIIERYKMNAEIDKMKGMISLLSGEKGKRYIDFLKAKSLDKNLHSITLVPNGTQTVYLPTGANTSIVPR